MTDNAAPKTSVELAMERLRKKDADAGVAARPMTDEQKRARADHMDEAMDARNAQFPAKTAGVGGNVAKFLDLISKHGPRHGVEWREVECKGPQFRVGHLMTGPVGPNFIDLDARRTAMAEQGVDFLAVSFVRTAHDLRVVREAIAPHVVPLVAKIETMSAVNDLADIVAEADAVMVARGDLGIECPLEDVPHLQKRIVRQCVEAGVPVITATQMMESMIVSPSPTRAEVSDIANAVFDGTDALMLSAETAVGADPVAVVRTMNRIAGRA